MHILNISKYYYPYIGWVGNICKYLFGSMQQYEQAVLCFNDKSNNIVEKVKSHKISIMHIAECAGGVERYLMMLLPLLRNEGFDQSLVCSQNYDKEKFSNIVSSLKQTEMSQTFSPIEVFKKVRVLRKYIKAMHPNIIYCHSSFAGGLGRLASIGMHCKVVYNPHGWAFNIQ